MWLEFFCGWLLLCGLLWGCTGSSDSSQDITVSIEGRAPQIFTAKDLSRLPRQTVRVSNHSGIEETYGGFWLRDVLAAAGGPLGDALIKTHLCLVVIVQASDHYRVAFSLAELDSASSCQPVLLADEAGGAKLKPDQGPWRLVAPGDGRFGRWVRQVVRIQVKRIPD